jgi:23S rRNA (uracil1939-C5)-methyltransferase
MSSEKLTLKIEKPAYGNLFIARHEGKVVMVRGHTMPVETVEAAVERERKDYIAASVSKVIDPSPDRIEPRCRYFGICGGCHYQHIPYELQVKLKEDTLRDCLKRIGKLDMVLSDSVVGDDPWSYRLRGQFKVSGRDIGFYKENSRDVVNIETCPVMADDINRYLSKARGLIQDEGIRELHITSGDKAAALLKVDDAFPQRVDMNNLASRFEEAGFSGLSIETSGGIMLDFGEPYITLEIDDLKYSVSPQSFLQSNWSMNLSMIRLIKEGLQPLKDKRILDLYSGAGNFTLPLADENDVTGVEENPYAVEDGRKNSESNEIRKCRFINSPAEDYRADEEFDILILDPPRPGLTNKAMRNVLGMLPEKIVYVSCNPTTLARDLRKLAARYDIESVRMIDLFPQTFHIEALAFLRLN